MLPIAFKEWSVICKALADGRLKGNETIQAQMVLTIGKVGLNHKVDGEIQLA